MSTKTQPGHEEFIRVDRHDYHCLFRRDAAGGYLVTCPELPPMTAFGETLSAARTNAAGEIVARLDAHRASFDPFVELRTRDFV
jgi:hypothetical protein